MTKGMGGRVAWDARPDDPVRISVAPPIPPPAHFSIGVNRCARRTAP